MMRRMRSPGVLIVGMLAISSCSSGTSSGSTPPGFVRTTGSKVSVAHPKDWQRGTPSSKIMTVTVSSQDAEVDVLENFLVHGAKGDKDMLVDTVEAGPTMTAPGYHRTHTRSIEVKGAKAAVRVDYTFTDGTKGPCQAVDVGVLGRDRQIHAVRVIWRRGRLDGTTVGHIIDSIRVK